MIFERFLRFLYLILSLIVSLPMKKRLFLMPKRIVCAA